MYVVGDDVNQYDKNQSDKNGSTSTTVFQTEHFSILAGIRGTCMPWSSLVAERHPCNHVIVSIKYVKASWPSVMKMSHL